MMSFIGLPPKFNIFFSFLNLSLKSRAAEPLERVTFTLTFELNVKLSQIEV